MTVPTRRPAWPMALSWLIILLDGFDLVVLGAVLPTLVGGGLIGFTPQAATYVATVGLVGVGLGAIVVTPMSDAIGRRRVMLACVAVFSVATLLIALSPDPWVFGALRFIAGIGLGACLPTVLAYVSEHARGGRTGSATTITMTGYHTGAVLTALLAIVVVPHWQWMFVIGGVAGILVLPVIWARLPESASFVAGVRRADVPPMRERLAAHLRAPWVRISIPIWITSFMGLLLVYGLNTWLPTLMAAAGYAATESLALLLVLNVGAVAGLLLAGAFADRRSIRLVAMAWFGLSAAFLALMSVRVDATVLVYAAVFTAGVFVFSSQVLVYALLSTLFPVAMRGAALGFAAGVGRAGAIAGPFITGALVSSGIAYPWGFFVFVAAALVAVAMLAIVPRSTPAVDDASGPSAAGGER